MTPDMVQNTPETPPLKGVSSAHGAGVSLDGMARLFEQESERNQELLIRWFSGEETLKSIGEQFGISKQRVQQIKDHFVDRVNDQDPELIPWVRHRLETVARRYMKPFNREILRRVLGEGFWSERFDYDLQVGFLKRVLRYLPLEGDEDALIPAELEEMEKKIYQLLQYYVEPVRPMVLYFEYGDEFQDINVLQWVVMVQRSDRIIREMIDGTVHLRPVTLSTADWVKKLLRESDSPLSESELARRYQDRFAQYYGELSSDYLMAHAGLFDEICRFDSHVWGLRKHLSLPEARQSEVRDAVYGYFKEQKHPEYMAFSGHLAEYANDQVGVSINGYEAAILLREDDRFRDLGRMVFTLSEGSLTERIPLEELIEQAMEEEGEPISINDLFDEISRRRSVSRNSLTSMLGMSDRFEIDENGLYRRSRS